MRRLGVVAVLLSLPAWAAEGNLLAGKVPVQVSGVNDPQRMTDGVASLDGDEWRSTRTSVIQVNGSAIWDLGEVKPIRAAMLQGDNNDDYLLEGSPDNATWTVLWRVHTVSDPGMRLRMIRTLDGSARYVRLTARGGDSSYSVSELELHSTPETMADSKLKRQRGRSSDELPGVLWAATLGAIALLVHNKQKILWVLGAPFVAALVWASLTALLDRFVG
ncbi:MAG: hypothetical protein H6Q89_2320 [Myxococcaceae bacterium]|nr:hypothetical protein [Myxococcaceae bacterium]